MVDVPYQHRRRVTPRSRSSPSCANALALTNRLVVGVFVRVKNLREDVEGVACLMRGEVDPDQ